MTIQTDSDFSVFFESLREGQAPAMHALLESLGENRKKILLEAPTRFGKTAIIWALLRGLDKLGLLQKPVLITVPTRLIREQTISDGQLFAPELFEQSLVEELTSIQQGLQSGCLVRIASKTLVNLLVKQNPDYLRGFAAIINDEGHLDLSEERKRNFSDLPGNIIALTATGTYSAAKSLIQEGYHPAYRISIAEAVNKGILCALRNVLVVINDVVGTLDEVALHGKDYETESLGNYLDQVGMYEKSAELIVRNAALRISQNKPLPISIGNCVTINTARMAAKILNQKWEQTFGADTPYTRDKLFQDMPENVREFYQANGMLDEIGPVAAPIWGDMPDCVRNYLIEAHRCGKLMMLHSAQMLIHGYTNQRASEIHNLCPSMSGVVVGQRGGRPLGLDPENPYKIATIFDYMLPATKHRQLTYGEWANGFIFTQSHSSPNDDKDKYNPEAIADTPALTVLADEKEILRYIRHGSLLAKIFSSPYLQELPRSVALACARRNLTTKEKIMEAMRNARMNCGMLDDPYWRTTGSLQNILATLRGEFSPRNKYGYTPATMIIASALQLDPRKVFDVKVGKPIPRDLDGITRRTQIRHIRDIRDPADWSVGTVLGLREDIANIDDAATRATLQEHTDSFNEADPLEAAMEREMGRQLNQALGTLAPRLERILRLRFGLISEDDPLFSFLQLRFGAISALDPLSRFNQRTYSDVFGLSLSQIGRHYGVGNERIRQLETRGLHILKHSARIRKLKDYSS